MSKRKGAEGLLRETERKQRHFLDSIQEGIWVIDRDSCTTFVNPQMAEMLGYSVSEMQGRHLLSFIDDHDVEPVNRCLERCGQGIRDRHDLELTRKDGTRVHTTLSISPITDDNGDYAGAIACVVDMTQRKRLEEEYRKFRERFSRIYNSPIDAIWSAAFDGTLLDVNDSFCKLTGYSKQELLKKKKYQDMTPVAYHEYEARIIDDILRTGRPAEYEKEYIRKDGSRVPTLLTTFVMEGHDGQPIGLASIVKDIAERKRSEEAVRTSEQKLRLMFESVTEGVTVTDLNGVITEANERAANIHGFASKEDLLGKSALEFVAESDRQRAIANMRRTLEQGSLPGIEYTLVKADGSEFPGEISAGVLRSTSGNPVGFVGTTRDVTERKRLRDNVQSYISEITQAQEEERRRIARELHDETAQSLAAILVDIESVTRLIGLSDEMIRQLDGLRERVESVMEGIRRFTHELRPRVLDELGLVSALEWLAAETSLTWGIETSVKIVGRKRRLASEVELALFRIAQEAVSNVRRHSEATEACIRVQFGPGKTRMDISDNGKGLKLPKRMHDFASVRKLGILGMHERSRLINGDLSLHSEEGKGTTITLEVSG